MYGLINLGSRANRVAGPLVVVMALALVINVLMGFQPVSADGNHPDIHRGPFAGFPQVTQPVTGAASTAVPTPAVPATPVPVDLEPLDSTTTTDDSGSLPDDSAVYAEQTSVNRAYTRFDVSQTARKDITGSLRVSGDNFDKRVPFTVTTGDELEVFAMFQGGPGPYVLELNADGVSSPILRVEGDLATLNDDQYSHQIINSGANPEFLVLDPDDVGVSIAVGSVRARLKSCVALYNPVDGIFELGVDRNGDNKIDGDELVASAIQNESSVCMETPESNIPLMSSYSARVESSQGTLMAQNEGLYDFLNNSRVDSDKEAKADLVKEFMLQWIRTPVAASVPILNQAIRPAAVEFTVVPQIEEITGDIITNEGNSGSSPETSIDSEGEDVANEALNSQENPLKFLVNNWVWIAIATGVVIATGFVIRHAVNVDSSRHR